MFTGVASSVFRSSILSSTRSYATQKVGKVAVLGAAGGIGQPLSLLLKNEPEVTHLNLYDIVNAVGVTADLSHISSPAQVAGFGGDDLDKALQGAEVVVIPAGVPRKPGMTRDDLFNTNASIVKTLAEACAKNCPDACLLIISNPVNSTVPIVAETLKKHGVYNKNKLFGVTTLDVTRAKTFISQLKGSDVNSLDIPVVGGHAGTTIVPILSKNTAGVTFNDEERDALTKRIQFGGDEVVKAKDGAGSATLSMAYAGAQFTLQLLRALNGAKDIVECSFVESSVTDSPFFATEIKLGVNGVEEILGLPAMTDYEKKLVDSAVPDLIKSVEKGVEFVKNN